jgi:hypothetical protein
MITVVTTPRHGKTKSIYCNLGIRTYKISYQKDRKTTTHTTLNFESFWDFMGHKNYQLIEIGYHYQLYITEY